MTWALFVASAIVNGIVQLSHQTNKNLDGQILEPVSVVIPAYNEEHFISGTLESVHNAMILYPDKVELIVVDNGSEDNTVEIASQYTDKIYSAMRGKLNALQTGILNATNDIIVTVDADVIFPPETIEEIAYHFRNPNLVYLQCGIRKLGASPLDNILALLKTEAGYTLIKYGSGTARTFRKNAFIAVGGYDLTVNQFDFWKMVREDEINLHQRLSKVGQTHLDPSIVFHHLDRRSLCSQINESCTNPGCIYCSQIRLQQRF